jgi:starch synthase
MDLKEKLNILFVTAECVPFCANGGVAEMCYSLPKYLNNTNEVDIRVILPLYSKIPEKYKNEFKLIGERTVELSWRKEYCGIYEYEFGGIMYYFVSNPQYFDRSNMFGYADDVERFSFFSKAVLDILPMINFYPDVIHTNDWQSGMVCTFLKVLEWQNSKYEHIKTVLNIHNLAFQGVCEFKAVKDLLGIDDKFAYLFDFYGKANLMKASILCSDKIVAVSETYAEEIRTAEKGSGLGNIIDSENHKLCGIINGIDYDFYDPETDPHIYQNYNKNSLDKKEINKLKFQEELGLEIGSNIPMFSFVGYMSSQKGLDLLLQVIPQFLEKGVQFVVIGGGVSEYENKMRKLAADFPKNVNIKFGFDSRYVKKIYASADFLFNISSTEPCGLCPMIANKYGSLPIIYATGGLKDNFSDFKYQNGNAYVLKDYDMTSLSDIISRALRDYQNKEKVKLYQISGMNQNFDIEICAEKYLKLYEEMSNNINL